MNIHKFNVKPKHNFHKTIKWLIPRDVKHSVEKINTSTWKIFCQENIVLQPNEVKQLTLGVGFMMSDGVVLVCLANSLRKKSCSIQNEVNLEDTNDIITAISNNSKETTSGKTSFYVFSAIKNYDYNIKMTEMKEKIYPMLPIIRESPSAPDIELTEMRNEGAHSYRLKVITDVQKYLEEEITKRENFSKKYFRISRVINSVDSVLISISLGAGITGAVLLSTVVAAPVVLGLEISAGAIGLISLLGMWVSK